MYEKSLELLNRAVRDELSGVHQYMYFHFHCDDQGFDLLAALFKKAAIDEMIHVEKLAERILFLKGDVDMNPSEPVRKVTDVREMPGIAAEMELQAMKDYNSWARECGQNADSVTKALFESIVVEEEGHYGQFDTEMENIKRFGDNYLALQSIERSKQALTGKPGA
ncbi:MAG: bacterioferritin [Hyphomicrobiales bacterium]|nr:MAG: bacterioferritin [Hyphomicrobiales bacterium]